ncbi:MAG TPA: HD domain-containing phosphohydrolase [Gaiellaceae bacterium]|nr:HD domain-containing phosphohydrolase [Gaiellaceae bacterium]
MTPEPTSTEQQPAALPRLSHREQWRELVSTVQRLSLARTIPEIQEIVRTAARRLTRADGATFVLREGSSCYYADEDAISPLWKGQRFPLEQCISGWAMVNRSAAVIEDIYADDRIPHDAYRPTFVKSLAMVPIRQLDPVGAIGNYWASSHRASADEVELLQALADSTAVALENVRVYRELEEARLETLRRLAIAAEYRDDATSEHAERVARTAALLAERLGRPQAEVELLRLAAPLHDIGKLAVPDALLLKPGPLTPAEVEQMRTHAAAGAEILGGSSSDVLRLGEEIARTHHEWWDGSGYPSGLAGEQIPLSGRLVALADVFDALTHERPYKRAWPLEEAVREIHRLSGRQFDPAVVAAFAQLDPRELVAPVAGARRGG